MGIGAVDTGLYRSELCDIVIDRGMASTQRELSRSGVCREQHVCLLNEELPSQMSLPIPAKIRQVLIDRSNKKVLALESRLLAAEKRAHLSVVDDSVHHPDLKRWLSETRVLFLQSLTQGYEVPLGQWPA